MIELTLEKIEQVIGGGVILNPNGSSDTEDKYYIIDDLTSKVLALAGGYRTARKLAEKYKQSPELAK